MKIQFYPSSVIILAISIAIINPSCKKNDPAPPPDPNSIVTIGNADYSMVAGQLDYYGIGSDIPASYNFMLSLRDAGLIYNSGTGQYTGTGTVAFLELYSSQQTILAPGMYYYDSFGTLAPNTFGFGAIITNYNPDAMTGNIRQLASGSLLISKIGNIYTITFNCVLSSAETLQGSYRGILSYSDKS